MVVQFVVITNGAGRVAEVAARFTLDAMPGKQMAIDADLNAGQITDEQARERRQEIQQEADFYGSMDGAAKFVKGDAIAAVHHHADQPVRRHRRRRVPAGPGLRRGDRPLLAPVDRRRARRRDPGPADLDGHRHHRHPRRGRRQQPRCRPRHAVHPLPEGDPDRRRRARRARPAAGPAEAAVPRALDR